MPEFEKKYNEIFRDGSIEDDQDRLRASLMPDGRRIRHYKRLPELSSAWQ
tara:strand:- start:331 stop:480 length:150 start_codon:yes stop_codon:yes gene_type:complete